MIAAGFARPARATMADQMWPMAALSVALSAMALAAMALDGRALDGVGVWAKPLKFSLSFAVYFATLALVIDRMGQQARSALALRVALGASVVSMLGEMAYIFVSAAQGVGSHFNVSSAFREQMYALMGIGAVTLVLAVALVGVAAWRDGEARMGPGLRRGVLLGFAGSTVLTLVTAGVLSSQGGHFVGSPAPGAATLPLLGWSAAVGDLRPAHFLALHAMQAVPLLGWLADRRGWLTAVVPAGAAFYALLTLAVFAQALAGVPLIRL